MARLRILQGDIFSSSAQTIVNTVNCVGVMGKGIALGFRKRFPEMYEDYSNRCRRGEVKLGVPYLYKQDHLPWVLNFPTKGDWRAVSRLSDIVAGLEHLERHYREWGISSLAVPPLGCGHGKLDWALVGPTLVRHLEKLAVPVELYAPHGTPPEQLTFDFLHREPSTAPTADDTSIAAWVAVAAILARVQSEPYHWPVGRIVFQKLAYFATQCGIPTGLSFRRSSYGPYSDELKSKITHYVNNGLLCEKQVDRTFLVSPGTTFEDALRAHSEALRDWEDVIEDVSDLILRLSKSREAEVAATVHFANCELLDRLGRTPSECEVLAEVCEWKQRRRPPFGTAELADEIRKLNILGLLEVASDAELPVTAAVTGE